MTIDVGEALEQVQHWRPDAQQKLLATLQSEGRRPWRPFFCADHGCNGQPHAYPVDQRECPHRYGHEWLRDEESDLVLVVKNAVRCVHCGVPGAMIDEWTFPHARADQRPPRWSGLWLTLFLRGGRGSGKTKTGAEITNQVSRKVSNITLVGATVPDIRNIMVEGDSGILACAKPGERPVWEPSKKQLTWPNGCVAIGYSAEEPERLRGQNSGYIWADEPAHWALVKLCWDNMLYGLRKGRHPKIVATSTPKATDWVKEQIAGEFTIDRRVSSDANLTNLSPIYRKTVIDPKRKTRLGKQEIDGEILEDVEGALWRWDYIHEIDDDNLPDMVTIVVAIDPAGTANKRSDETGIIVIGMDAAKNLYVLADLSGKYSPSGWARAALRAVEVFSADRVVYEKNYGGDMVLRVLEAEVDAMPSGYLAPAFKEVTSRRGKEIRAEPIVAVYQKTRVFHVTSRVINGRVINRGKFEKLETEQTTWIPGVSPSPNRVDALVHGATNLLGGGGDWAYASPADL
jgi:phage terminase large subunit-like protein